MPTVYYLFEMERLGVQANAEVLKEMSELLERRVWHWRQIFTILPEKNLISIHPSSLA